MASDNPAIRLRELRREIGFALGRGEDPGSDLDEFEFLWQTTPDSERDGLSFTLKDIQAMVEKVRRRIAAKSGAGKIRSLRITHRDPCCTGDDSYRGGCL